VDIRSFFAKVGTHDFLLVDKQLPVQMAYLNNRPAVARSAADKALAVLQRPKDVHPARRPNPAARETADRWAARLIGQRDGEVNEGADLPTILAVRRDIERELVAWGVAQPELAEAVAEDAFPGARLVAVRKLQWSMCPTHH
jgi:hypothetical protein